MAAENSPPQFGMKMNVVKIKSYAKVNLTLEVVGERARFHLLDSFVANVDLFNLVVVQKRKDKLVSGRMKGMGHQISFLAILQILVC